MNPDKTKQIPSMEEIVHDFGKMVSVIARRMIQDREVAREAAQEVWLEVMKSLPGFRGESKLSTWIYTIARRTVMKHLKNEKKWSIRAHRKYNRLPDYIQPEDKMLEKEEWVRETCDLCVTAMLHCLDRETRLAYIFRKAGGLPYPEIARIMEKEESAVRQMLSRGIRRLNYFLSLECGIYNPKGGCNCRMKKWLKESALFREAEMVHNTVRKMNYLMLTEKILPGKNYWEEYLTG